MQVVRGLAVGEERGDALVQIARSVLPCAWHRSRRHESGQPLAERVRRTRLLLFHTYYRAEILSTRLLALLF